MTFDEWIKESGADKDNYYKNCLIQMREAWEAAMENAAKGWPYAPIEKDAITTVPILRAFNQYFMSSITKNPNPPNIPCGAFDLIATADKTKDEFCARDEDGDYIEDGLNAAWWAWQEALKSLKPMTKNEVKDQMIDLAHSAHEEALSFGLDLSVFQRYMHAIVKAAEKHHGIQA